MFAYPKYTKHFEYVFKIHVPGYNIDIAAVTIFQFFFYFSIFFSPFVTCQPKTRFRSIFKRGKKKQQNLKNFMKEWIQLGVLIFLMDSELEHGHAYLYNNRKKKSKKKKSTGKYRQKQKYCKCIIFFYFIQKNEYRFNCFVIVWHLKTFSFSFSSKSVLLNWIVKSIGKTFSLRKNMLLSLIVDEFGRKIKRKNNLSHLELDFHFGFPNSPEFSGWINHLLNFLLFVFLEFSVN